jgi:hypothetical protein
MTKQNPEQEKENQFAVIAYWNKSGFLMNTMPGMEKHLMMLNHALQ